MRVLVCGDRNWKDKEKIHARLLKLPADTEILHGDCRGADRIAAEVAVKLGFKVRAFPAEWDRFGLSAGPRRNRQMLDENPALVIAFHANISQSRGTADTVREAKRRGITGELIT